MATTKEHYLEYIALSQIFLPYLIFLLVEVPHAFSVTVGTFSPLVNLKYSYKMLWASGPSYSYLKITRFHAYPCLLQLFTCFYII